jgi:ribonuclease HI
VLRVPDVQTNNRGEVYAILDALQTVHGDVTLHIYSDSEYAMESITARAAAKAAHGWKIINGDLLRDIATLICQRTAAIMFIQVKGHSGNFKHDEADKLANLGATLDPVAPYCPLGLVLPKSSSR